MCGPRLQVSRVAGRQGRGLHYRVGSACGDRPRSRCLTSRIWTRSAPWPGWAAHTLGPLCGYPTRARRGGLSAVRSGTVAFRSLHGFQDMLVAFATLIDPQPLFGLVAEGSMAPPIWRRGAQCSSVLQSHRKKQQFWQQ